MTTRRRNFRRTVMAKADFFNLVRSMLQDRIGEKNGTQARRMAIWIADRTPPPYHIDFQTIAVWFDPKHAPSGRVEETKVIAWETFATLCGLLAINPQDAWVEGDKTDGTLDELIAYCEFIKNRISTYNHSGAISNK